MGWYVLPQQHGFGLCIICKQPLKPSDKVYFTSNVSAKHALCAWKEEDAR
jgi:hypothetical protein